MKKYDEDSRIRKELVEKYRREGGLLPEWIARTMTVYNRYFEAGNIIKCLEERGQILGPEFCVVDYGCAVGDYGFAFGRQGCMVLFYDVDVAINFVNYRLSHEDPQFGHLTMPTSAAPEFNVPDGGCNLAIFGEVLEHLTNPLEILTKFKDAGTTYIFTSSYPYRRDEATDDYWHQRGHLDEARLQQPACRELLEKHYKKIGNFGGQMNLWKLRT